MSKPWYYTIGYPVKVLYEGAWRNGIICNGYRHEDGIINTMTEVGPVGFGAARREEFLKPNLPDDNPWIPTKERLPKDSEYYERVYMTIKPYTYPETIKGSWSYDKFYYANGKPVQCPVLAWKYLRYPKPYKEES